MLGSECRLNKMTRDNKSVVCLKQINYMEKIEYFNIYKGYPW